MLFGAFLVELICFGSHFQLLFFFSMHSHFFFYNGKLQHKTLKVEKWLLRTLPVAFLLEFAYCGHLAGYLFITKTKCLPVKNLIESGSFKSWGKVHFGHFIPSKCAVLFDLIDLKKKKPSM